MTGPSPGSDTPRNDSQDRDEPPAWPQPLRFIPLAFAFMILAVGTLAVALAVRDLRRAPFLLAPAGFVGGAAALALLSLLGFQEAGFRHIRLSRTVQTREDPDFGTGVRIPMSRTLAPLLIAALAGGAVYGASAAAAWYLGVGEALLPSGRDTRGGAMVMAGCAIGSIAVILLFTVTRFDTTVSIYRDGVERYVRRRILFSTQVSRLFLPWNEISAIGVGDIGVRGNFEPGKHPAIDLYTEFVPDSVRTLHDTDHRITLMAHVLPVEPNTLLALLRKLHAEPEQRALITRPDAVELLRPPPLFERFRAARAQKTAR